MSTFPATDLIVDVARAADPKRQQVALRRLEAAATNSAASFASVAGETGGGAQSNASSTWRAAGVGLRAASQTASNAPMPTVASNAAVDATKKFESLVLQVFFEALLPKDEEQYGSGAAGGVWRSMMAEQLANRFAASGAVGLNKVLEKHIAPAASCGPNTTQTS
jgi:peptidoglycan hydrolase FlgJ